MTTTHFIRIVERGNDRRYSIEVGEDEELVRGFPFSEHHIVVVTLCIPSP